MITPTTSEILNAIVEIKMIEPNAGVKTVTKKLKENPTWSIGPVRVREILKSHAKNITERVEKNRFIDKLLKNGDEYKFEDSFLSWSLNNHNKCVDYYEWVISNVKLRANTYIVPSEIMKDSGLTEVELHDVRVYARKFQRRKKDGDNETEDTIYEKSAEIRRRVARGNSLLSFNIEDKKLLCFPLKAMRKFTGGMGDDDDLPDSSVSTWKDFFVKDVSDAKKIVSTKKENGSAAHLACLKIKEQYYLIVGSKNVHLVVRKREDIQLYADENRFHVAKVIAHTVFDTLIKLQNGSEPFLEYLSQTHQTACFELLDPNEQHVEDFSNLKSPTLKFFAFTNADDEILGQELDLCVSPLKSLEVAKNFGLDVVDYQIHEITSPNFIEEIQTSIRKELNVEGKVLYFLDQNSNVIGMLKKKTIWYISLRAIREKMKLYSSANHNNLNTINESMPSKLKRRFEDIKSWLNLPDTTIFAWMQLAIGMSNWLCQILKNKENIQLEGKFPVLWKRYLKETSQMDNID